VYHDIVKFININKLHCSSQFKFCVSNISNSNLNNEQYYSILKHYGIKYIEIAPTKFGSWNDMFTNIINFTNIKNKMELFGLNLYSFQSITYNITNNIFDDNNSELILHLQKVIDLACNNGIKNIVFGCPKNRKILNASNINNDSKFIDVFIKLGNYINDRDLIISIENNSKKYDCNYLNTIEEVGEFVIKINHTKIKMMVDIGNCIMENDNIENLIYYKDIINHIHISMPFLNPLINYNSKIYIQFIQILKQINYDKVISLEFLNNNENELEKLNKSLSNFLHICTSLII